MLEVLRVARKEFRDFFASPAAYLFLGGFLAVTLFVFFWVETFFARNIADVRPLFQWMPVLLIFLVAALTMRSWSEERRAGTLESLLTAPVRPLHLVLGKFAAALGLVALALVLTLPLPITVSRLGSLDWGPVIGGYLATLFLAAAYAAIGLYMSARTDNPIVALILTAAANFVAANLWLAPVGWARIDMTEGDLYSLSEATERQLDRLREPLLIRGYFSSKTHPLLAPLVPRLKDLLEEYAVAAGGRAQVEFVDPTRDTALAEEAAAKYGIRPVPFQTASRYQAAVVNSYFDLVVAYGDQYETLGFRDLIEVKVRGERDLDVALKNPEYSITRAIRRVVNAYQAGGNPFEALSGPVAS